MREVSARWDRALRQSHRIAVEADVLYGRQVIATGVSIVDGSVTLDVAQEVRARCNLQLAAPIPVPAGPTTTVSPFGYELAVRVGIEYPDGVREVQPVGVFGVQVDESQVLAADVSGDDRSRAVIDATFEDDVEVVPGTNARDAIIAIISGGVDGLTYFLPSTPHTVLQAALPAGSSRWSAAADIATSVGWDLCFDGTGALAARQQVTPASTPVWTLDDGDGGVLLDLTVQRDRGPAHNRHPVASRSASAGQVFTAVATDTDPLSPTYYLGPFGRKPAPVWESEWISSQQMADDTADGRLARGAGLAVTYTFQAIPNPAIEVGDPVIVDSAVQDLYAAVIVEAYTLGLGPGGVMQGRCRTQVAA